MTDRLDTLHETTPPGERWRSARVGKVTAFCHSFRGWESVPGRPSSGPSVAWRATPTPAGLPGSPPADEC